MHRLVLLGAGASGAAAVALYLAMALVHLRDNYHVDHVTGAWMGLAAYADDGTLYPPLFDDGFYGGTRYGPLGIVGNTAAAKVTGEYLVSGKAVSLLLMVALLALVYRICRHREAPVAVSLAAAGTVVASFVTFFAGTTIYGDLLSTLLQLTAVALVLRRADTTSTAAAGALAALAVTAKFSGLWGGAAVLVWLAVHHRRLLVPFLAAGASTGLAVFGLATVASDGRMQDNLLGLGASGFAGMSALITQTPNKAIEALTSQALGTALLLPVAVLVLLLALLRRRLELLELALLLCGLLTLVVLTDVGTGFNHLLDLAVLVPLVVAGGYARWHRTVPRLALALAAVIPLATAVSLYDLRHDVRETATAALDGETVERWQTAPLSDRLGDGPYFTEDPMVAVENGDRPVALDAFMLLRLAREHPEWEQLLIDRFERREFDTVVLITDLDLTGDWWRTSHLGLPIATAIDRNYVLEDKVQGPTFAYRVLTPKPSSLRGHGSGPAQAR